MNADDSKRRIVHLELKVLELQERIEKLERDSAQQTKPANQTPRTVEA